MSAASIRPCLQTNPIEYPSGIVPGKLFNPPDGAEFYIPTTELAQIRENERLIVLTPVPPLNTPGRIDAYRRAWEEARIVFCRAIKTGGMLVTIHQRWVDGTVREITQTDHVTGTTTTLVKVGAQYLKLKPCLIGAVDEDCYRNSDSHQKRVTEKLKAAQSVVQSTVMPNAIVPNALVSHAFVPGSAPGALRLNPTLVATQTQKEQEEKKASSDTIPSITTSFAKLEIDNKKKAFIDRVGPHQYSASSTRPDDMMKTHSPTHRTAGSVATTAITVRPNLPLPATTTTATG